MYPLQRTSPLGLPTTPAEAAVAAEAAAEEAEAPAEEAEEEEAGTRAPPVRRCR